MSERNFKLGFSIKLISITMVVAVCFIPDSFGRNGLKLYSIGNNSAWSSASTWSLSVNGQSAGIVPQNNDTVIIDRTVIQNLDVAFSGFGILDVLNTGLLRGDNQSLEFSGDALLKCNGESKINNLSMNGNSTLLVESTGKILVKNTFTVNSLSNHIVSGKLSVTGMLSMGSAVNISGNGAIESAHFNGSGSVLGINPASLIPDGSLITEYNWLGTKDKNWNEPLNWAGRKIPANNSNIAVVSLMNNPEITGKAYSNNLFVNSGSSITVYPNAIFEINGNLSITGGGKFLLKNTISEKSSLILNGVVSGKIQSEYPVLKGQKNLISSPVESALSQTFLNMYLRSYDEAASQWGEYIVPTNNPLQVMQGYELYSLSSDTRIFEGTPNQEQKSYLISNSGNGLNLTGNPFTCFLDWENNENNLWQRNSIASAIYYPDPSGSGNFSVYLPGGDDAVSLNNGSRFIAPMQGFFVKAGTQGSLTVTKNSRVSNINRSKLVIKNNAIKLKLNDSDGTKDEVMFRVMENSTSSFDDQLDAIKIPGNTDSPSLNLESDDDVKYAINTIPSVNSSLNIPMNISCFKAGMFSVSAVGASDFEYRYPVILEDKELNNFIDLRVDSVYSFYHAPEMKSDRFEIHFTSPQAVVEEAADPTDVTITPGEVIISGGNNDIYTAILVSTDGKLISTSKGSLSAGINLSTGNRAAGICILQLSNGKQTITKKVFTK
ncbi:MAG: T9SS type A sorting domain-containing protein [Bacteroidales bacterium]|nr:T9SS type A sorting domain-containing protein [Bacteroidales bacterium]